MAPKSTGGLPLPPADLDQRKLPLKLIGRAAFRIHLASRDCLYFGNRTSGRFDDPLGQYGVLYAALGPEGAFAEVFLRRLSWMLIRELDLDERCLSEVSCNRIRCVDLTGEGLRRVSCDNRIAAEKPCAAAQQWSRAFFAHPQKPDGIIYRSRHNPRFKCLALFDRCESRVKVTLSKGLMSSIQRTWTIKQIARYDLAIEPMP